MKQKLLFIISVMLLSVASVAQVSINSDGSLPDNSAMLDVKSTIRGLLPPRMTTAQRDAIVSPVAGLQIFNTTTNCLEFYVNGFWQTIRCGCTAAPASAPAPANQIASDNQIIWNWNTVPGATGYKYNTVNNSSIR